MSEPYVLPVDSVHVIHREVVPGDVDGLGHANNTVHVRWMQECATAHSAAAGWPHERYLELGVAWMVRRHEIVYLRPADLGMRVRIETWVSGFHRASSRRCYRILEADTGRELARATTDWAFVDLKSGRPVRIPEEIITGFPVRAGPFDSV